MKVLTFIFLLVLIMPLQLWAQSKQDDQNWKLAKDAEKIKIYTRKLPETDIRQIKVKMQVEASVSSLVALIKDSEEAPRWVNRVKLFEDLEIINDTSWYTYTEINMPWPFANRDMITHNILQHSPEGDTTFISIESKPSYIASKQGLERIKRSEGTWQFVAQDQSETEVTYIIFAESNSILPGWLVNPLIVKGVYTTMQDMKAILKEGKYHKI